MAEVQLNFDLTMSCINTFLTTLQYQNYEPKGTLCPPFCVTCSFPSNSPYICYHNNISFSELIIASSNII